MSGRALSRLFKAALLLAALVAPSRAWSQSDLSFGLESDRTSVVAALLRAPQQMVIGNPKGHDSVFEYYDYRCPFCRRMEPAMVKMRKQDPEIRIVLKPWPIFGPPSTYAARVAIAASWQGKLRAVHEAFFTAKGPLDRQHIREIAQSVGVDLKRLASDLKKRRQDLDQILASNAAEARALALKGTPGLVIGGQIVRGAVTFKDLQSLISEQYWHGTPSK